MNKKTMWLIAIIPFGVIFLAYYLDRRYKKNLEKFGYLLTKEDWLSIGEED